MQFLKFFISKSFLKNLFFALCFLAIALFGTIKYLDITTNHGQQIPVPDLSAMSVAEASAALKNEGLRIEVVDSASFNPEYPAKSVLEQKPMAGTAVKENRKIYVTLNPSKFQNIKIPPVWGKTKRQALSELQATGFNIGEFSYVRDIGLDVVRGVSHEGKRVKRGDKLPKYATVNLVLGDGKGR